MAKTIPTLSSGRSGPTNSKAQPPPFDCLRKKLILSEKPSSSTPQRQVQNRPSHSTKPHSPCIVPFTSAYLYASMAVTIDAGNGSSSAWVGGSIECTNSAFQLVQRCCEGSAGARDPQTKLFVHTRAHPADAAGCDSNRSPFPPTHDPENLCLVERRFPLKGLEDPCTLHKIDLQGSPQGRLLPVKEASAVSQS